MFLNRGILIAVYASLVLVIVMSIVSLAVAKQPVGTQLLSILKKEPNEIAEGKITEMLPGSVMPQTPHQSAAVVVPYVVTFVIFILLSCVAAYKCKIGFGLFWMQFPFGQWNIMSALDEAK